MQFFNNVLKKIAQTMRINNVFATNSKMQRKKAQFRDEINISLFTLKISKTVRAHTKMRFIEGV